MLAAAGNNGASASPNEFVLFANFMCSETISSRVHYVCQCFCLSGEILTWRLWVMQIVVTSPSDTVECSLAIHSLTHTTLLTFKVAWFNLMGFVKLSSVLKHLYQWYPKLVTYYVHAHRQVLSSSSELTHDSIPFIFDHVECSRAGEL